MLKWPAFLTKVSALSLALTVSFLLHGMLLSLHFSFPDASRKLQDKALDVILVNSRAAHKPTDAQALAQANLDGGGNVEEDRRAATPLPPTQKTQSGDQLEQMQRRVQELENRQQRLLAQASQAKAPPQEKAVDPLPKTPTAISGLDLAESARAMARLEGEISRNTEEYNKRPRKKFVSARTQEYRFAQYIEDWRQKVERVGTLNYPEAARGKLYGTLVLTVTLGREGEIITIHVDRSSGHQLLDEAARRIVQLAGPYAAFPPTIRQDTDQLVITRSWTFTRSDSVETK